MRDIEYNFLHTSPSPYINKNKIKRLLNGQYSGLIGYSDINDDETVDINGIKVLKILYDSGINEEYLNQPINNKIVLTPVSFNRQMIPTTISSKMMIINSLSEIDTKNTFEKINNNYYITKVSHSSDYAVINYTDEKYLYEIYKNFYLYKFDNNDLCYKRISKQEGLKQLIKYVTNIEIARITGNPTDRIADYSKLIYWLLSKVNLNEKEKEILEPFLRKNNINNDELKKLIDRETMIQNKISELRKEFENIA